MEERRLLVDFENVPQFDLSTLADDFCVTIFVGSCQKTLPFELVQATQNLGSRVEWLKVNGSGNNALDFHIAFHLGCLLTRAPQTQCFVLSKDCGFDPLMRYLKSKGFHCRRINSLVELDPQACSTTKPSVLPAAVGEPTNKPEGTSKPKSKLAVVADPNYERIVQALTKSLQKSRPATRKSLTNHVDSILSKKLTEAEVQRLVNLLFAEGKVTETNKALTYAL